MKYKVEFSRTAEKQLKSIPQSDLKKIAKRADKLASDPFPQDCEKLKGSGIEVYRVRQGDYRILYTVLEKKLIVLVVKIGHRKDVYKEFR